MVYILIFIFTIFSTGNVVKSEKKDVFDNELYESVLDPALCVQQVHYIIQYDSALLTRFLDAGFRIPRGIQEGNLVDLGNYHQCLAINQEAGISTIQGKYCTIRIPTNQEIVLPNFWPEFNLATITFPNISNSSTVLNNQALIELNKYQDFGRIEPSRDSPNKKDLFFTLAICLPRSCSTKQFMEGLFVNVSAFSFTYEEGYCRLPNDKKWVAADYVAIIIFSFLTLLVIASTFYELFLTRVKYHDPKSLNKIFVSFSVLTNTRRLVTYTPVPGAIECIDGIRALAMMWVVVGHTYGNQLSYYMANPIDILNFLTSVDSVWVTIAPFTVDTFFMLSGLLLVYNSTKKLSGTKLLKSLHLFYLTRLLRLLPILAAFVLLQASLLNRIFDGPHWTLVETMTQDCRTYWWSTLLYVQNWVNPSNRCIPHSWYLAIDFQLYIVSPLVLFFVVSKRKYIPWIALFGALLAFFIYATIYNFRNDFSPGFIVPSRSLAEQNFYMIHYYMNTLTRGSPFFVGMIYGYILHLFKKDKMVISKITATILWTCFVLVIFLICYVTHITMQLDWENQTVDNLINSYMRPAWAMAIGWMVLACSQGYGGPINWVLSLECWKVISRLSYAIYVVHQPLIYIINSTALAPTHFSVPGSLLKFISYFGLATLVAYILTLLIDAPCSTLLKLYFGSGTSTSPPMRQEPVRRDPEGINKF